MQGEPFSFGVPFFVFSGATIDPGLPVSESSVEDSGQMSSHGLDCFAGTETRREVAEASAQIAVAVPQGTGSHAQGIRDPVFGRAAFLFDDFARR